MIGLRGPHYEMKLATKQSKFARKLEIETAFMFAFIFPCEKTGLQLKNEDNILCNGCKVLFDCIDYYASSPNQNGKVLTFDDFLRHRKNNKNRSSRKY